VITLFIAPVLGAIADFSASKKRFLLFFAYLGALFTVLLYFSRSGDVYRTLMFFLLAQICFVAANVFYDAFLPHIASEDQMDRVSGKGYAYVTLERASIRAGAGAHSWHENWESARR